MIKDTSRIIKHDSAAIQELEDEAVLLNISSGQYYRLDSESLRIFQALLSAPSLAIAFESLNREYAVPPEQLKADLLAFIESLVDAGLVMVVDEPLE